MTDKFAKCVLSLLMNASSVIAGKLTYLVSFALSTKSSSKILEQLDRVKCSCGSRFSARAVKKSHNLHSTH